MDATEALKAACQTASTEAALIDAKIRDKLLKRARRHAMDEGEVIKQLEAWKRAAKWRNAHISKRRRRLTRTPCI